MKKIIIQVEGMTCQNCVRHVTEALEEVAGVVRVEVSLEAKTADLEVSENFNEASAREAVDEAGYEVKGVQAA